jgi:hypothetical protein
MINRISTPAPQPTRQLQLQNEPILDAPEMGKRLEELNVEALTKCTIPSNGVVPGEQSHPAVR